MLQLILKNPSHDMRKYKKSIYGINCNICVCLEVLLFYFRWRYLQGLYSSNQITWIIFEKAKFY